MSVWFTSDHHFGHGNIIRYCKRPFASVQAMDEEMIFRWNSKVKADDEVYYLGDFSLSKRIAFEYAPRLNGKIHFVAGNHDACHVTRKNHRSLAREYIQAGFHKVYPHVTECRLETGQLLTLCHLPYIGHDNRYADLLPDDEGNWLLHGHVHQHWKVDGRQINVGVDVWDFYPVSAAQVAELIRIHDS